MALASAAAFMVVVFVACSIFPEPPRRPSNVSADAVLVGGAKAWWWIKCWRSEAVNRCQVFNAEGISLYDEPYLPADGAGPVEARDLQIDRERTQVTRVFLQNGRVLLPSTDYELHKRLLEESR